MTPSGNLPRVPAEVLSEWRRLVRLLDAALDDDERERVAIRIEQLKAEYRASTDMVIEPRGAPPLEQVSGSRGPA